MSEIASSEDDEEVYVTPPEDLYISHALSDLLLIPIDCKVSRTIVTMKIVEYIKLNGLRDGVRIQHNEQLERVFGNKCQRLALLESHGHTKEQAEMMDMTFFALQLFLSPHLSLFPPLPVISPAQRMINEELQLIVFDRPGDQEARHGSLLFCGGPRFKEVQNDVLKMCN